MSSHSSRSLENASVAVPLFEFVLNRAANRQISALIETLEVRRDEVLAHEGDPGDGLFIVASGTLKLSKTLPDRRRQVVAFRGVGDFVGLHRGHTPWPVTVQGTSAGSVYRLSWDDLRAVTRDHPQIDRALLDLAGDEIAALQDHLLTLGRKTTEEKIASFLLSFYRANGLQIHARREIHLPMRRTEIADYLGLTTASVSRELTRLKQERIVALPRPSRIVMLDPARLEASALGGPSPGPAPRNQSPVAN